MKMKKMKIYNTILNSGNRNTFSGPKLKNKKNGEQLKHRNIMNEILWIYGNIAFGIVQLLILQFMAIYN